MNMQNDDMKSGKTMLIAFSAAVLASCAPKEGTDSFHYLMEEFADLKIPYDFYFESDSANRLYCFELVAACYPELEFEKHEVKKFFGLVKRQVYLSKSFIESKNVVKMFEYNPRLKSDFSKLAHFSR